MTYWFGYTFILMTGTGLGLGLILAIRRHLAGRLRPGLENLVLALFALFLSGMLVELFFRFHAQTDNANGYTLASYNWFERYWVLNSMGYRDAEWTVEALHRKRKILVMGDSFAAGYGIEAIEDRFSNRLNEKLGDDYLVMNIAENGLSTREEIERVKGFPYKPDIVILQYYINDIKDAAKDRNEYFTVPKTPPWPIIEPLVRNSYALNLVWWRLAPLGPSDWDESYFSWVKEIYGDPEIWWLHEQELQAVYEGARSEGVELIVVVFPALVDVQGSRVITTKVIDFFAQRGVPVLDVAEYIETEPPSQLVVSRLDAHPSVWLHHLVADKLYDLVIQVDSEVKRP